jgi:hypothetical protein
VPVADLDESTPRPQVVRGVAQHVSDMDTSVAGPQKLMRLIDDTGAARVHVDARTENGNWLWQGGERVEMWLPPEEPQPAPAQGAPQGVTWLAVRVAPLGDDWLD